MEDEPAMKQILDKGELLQLCVWLQDHAMRHVQQECQVDKSFANVPGTAAAEMAVRLMFSAVDSRRPALYKVLADLLNLRQRETGQLWFYDAVADELNFHIITECVQLCSVCGLRQTAGSGQLWCAICAAKV